MANKVLSFLGVVIFGYIFIGVGLEDFINETVIDGRLPFMENPIDFNRFVSFVVLTTLGLVLLVLIDKELQTIRSQSKQKRNIDLHSL